MNFCYRILWFFFFGLFLLACKGNTEEQHSDQLTEHTPVKPNPKTLRDSLLSFSQDTLLPFGAFYSGDKFLNGKSYDLLFFSPDSSQNFTLELIRDSANTHHVLCRLDSISLEMDSIHIEFKDANFDGFQDLIIQRTDLLGVHLPSYYLFLFDPSEETLIPVPNSLEFLGLEVQPSKKRLVGNLIIHCDNSPIVEIAKYCLIYGRWEGNQLIRSAPDCPCKGQILE